MRRTHSTGRILARTAACAGAALLLTACASDPGEKVVDAPFPELVEVPPRPEATTTPEERAALRTQLERRRDEVNRAAASLLRGGTEPVPVALDSQVPPAPSRGRMPPPPLPKGLPPSPERPQYGSGEPADEKARTESPKSASQPRGEEVIEAPGEAQMPPPRAAGEKDSEEEAAEEADENGGED